MFDLCTITEMNRLKLMILLRIKERKTVIFNFSCHAKGQIISEQNYGVLNFPKKQRNYCKDFCLASQISQMGQIRKIKALYYIKWYH